MEGGRVRSSGACSKILETYQHGATGPATVVVPEPCADLAERAYATSVAIETEEGASRLTFSVGQTWRIRIGFRVVRRQNHFVTAVGLTAADGTSVQTAWVPPRDLEPGNYEAVFVQDRVILEAGTYSLLVGLNENERVLQQFEAARLELSGENVTGYYPATSGIGAVLNSMHATVNRLPTR